MTKLLSNAKYFVKNVVNFILDEFKSIQSRLRCQTKNADDSCGQIGNTAVQYLSKHQQLFTTVNCRRLLHTNNLYKNNRNYSKKKILSDTRTKTESVLIKDDDIVCLPDDETSRLPLNLQNLIDEVEAETAVYSEIVTDNPNITRLIAENTFNKQCDTTIENDDSKTKLRHTFQQASSKVQSKSVTKSKTNLKPSSTVVEQNFLNSNQLIQSESIKPKVLYLPEQCGSVMEVKHKQATLQSPKFDIEQKLMKSVNSQDISKQIKSYNDKVTKHLTLKQIQKLADQMNAKSKIIAKPVTSQQQQQRIQKIKLDAFTSSPITTPPSPQTPTINRSHTLGTFESSITNKNDKTDPFSNPLLIEQKKRWQLISKTLHSNKSNDTGTQLQEIKSMNNQLMVTKRMPTLLALARTNHTKLDQRRAQQSHQNLNKQRLLASNKTEPYKHILVNTTPKNFMSYFLNTKLNRERDTLTTMSTNCHLTEPNVGDKEADYNLIEVQIKKDLPYFQSHKSNSNLDLTGLVERTVNDEMRAHNKVLVKSNHFDNNTLPQLVETINQPSNKTSEPEFDKFRGIYTKQIMLSPNRSDMLNRYMDYSFQTEGDELKTKLKSMFTAHDNDDNRNNTNGEIVKKQNGKK